MSHPLVSSPEDHENGMKKNLFLGGSITQIMTSCQYNIIFDMKMSENLGY
jgi:hypothetical protein